MIDLLPFLCQSGGDWMARETRAVRLSGQPSATAPLGGPYPIGDHCPIGSVEFCRDYALTRGITIPSWETYPEPLRAWLGRSITKTVFANVAPDAFCKPVVTKAFTGAIKQHITEAVSPDELVWVSPAVRFGAEWRVYVHDGCIAGYSRYDDGDDDHATLDLAAVRRMVADFASAPVGYSLDVGLVDGALCLVEANDGWALGLYPWGTLTGPAYLSLVAARWRQILETP